MGNTPIVGPHTGSKQTLIDFAKAVGALRMDEVIAFFDELFAQSIMDGFMIAVQSAVETANWKSEYWRDRLNPGALGLLGGPNGGIDEDLKYGWKNGQDAARAMLIHHVAYTGIAMPSGWEAWLRLDPRYQIARDKYAGRVKTWSDYGGHGNEWRWAADPKYYEAIMTREKWVRQYQKEPNPTPQPPPKPSPQPQQNPLSIIMGVKPVRVGFGWKEVTNLPYYKYFEGHGGHANEHTGLDLLGEFGDAIHTPSDGVVTCAGIGNGNGSWNQGCAAFKDTGHNPPEDRWGNPFPSLGVGRVEVLLDTGVSVIFGHARESYVKVGQRVKTGDRVCSMGGMNGPHIHLETRTWDGKQYWIVDPNVALKSVPKPQPQPEPTPQLPTPRIIDKPLGVRRYILNRNGKQPRYIFIHIQEGTNAGSWSHFHNVKASSTVMIGRNGEIWRVVPEQHGPWTNGDVKNPTQYGLAGILKETRDPNELSLTIELEGYTYAPNAAGWPAKDFPKPQRDALVWQVLTWSEKYNIPLERIFVLRHGDVNSVDRSFCPPVEIHQFALDTAKGIDVTPPPPAILKPIPIPNFDGTADLEYNGSMWHAQPTAVTISKDVAARQWANQTAGTIHDPFTKGTKVEVFGWVNGEEVEGERRWWVAKDWSRIWAGATVEEPDPPKLIPPYLPDGTPDDQPDVPDFPGKPTVVNGISFHPVGDGKGHRIKVAATANLRKYANTSSAVVGQVQKGQKVRAAFWVRGEEFEGEDMWWVLDNIDGPRLWAGATVDQPL